MRIRSLRRWTVGVVLMCVSLVGSGCLTLWPNADAPSTGPSVARDDYGAWRQIAPDIERFEVSPAEPTSTHLVMYRLQPNAFEWSFEYASSARRISEWAAERQDVGLLVNATYFHEDFSPSGYLNVDGKRIGRRQFDLDQSSVLRLHPMPQIVEEVKSQEELGSESNAAQSYPLLLRQGKPGITEDSGLLARRTAVGTDIQGRIYVIIAPDQPVSLYGLMRQLGRMRISWKSVLNLDGGPSSGMMVRAGTWSELHDSFASVPIVLMARHK